MGDSIAKLPTDDSTEIVQKDITNLKNFFNTTIQKKSKSTAKTEPKPETSKNIYSILKYVLLIALLYYICSHPSSVGRFVNEKYRLLFQTAVFGIILTLYLYLT